MSNLEVAPGLTECGGLADVAGRPVRQLYEGRQVQLGGGTLVRRLLPNLGRRLVGPWCFVDHYGPDDIARDAGMQVAPHPHIGLQTVSWLLAGEVHHTDSIGSDQVIHPGELGVMTAGIGIAHAEQSPVPHPTLLHGVQLWVALPERSRNVAPAWQHERALPVHSASGMRATVFMGTLDGAASPGTVYSPVVGVDLELAPAASFLLPLEPDFEYALLCMDGALEVEGTVVGVGAMLYLGTGRHELRIRTAGGAPARSMLLGGAPFEEQIVMWWNFVARSTEEVLAAREQWRSGDARFGVVHGFDGPVTPAPPIPAGRLKPSGGARKTPPDERSTA